MDPGRLAELVAEGMREIVPDGFFISFDGNTLWYSAEPGRFPGQQGRFQVGTAGTRFVINFYGHGGTVGERIVSVTIQSLSELQDFIDEASHDPWPGERRPPSPNAEIRGSELHCWFEDGDDVVVACRPIPLGDGWRDTPAGTAQG